MDREDKLYLQNDEIGKVQALLLIHGYTDGLAGLLELA